MIEILSTFKNSNSREKLGILADVFGIVGVSLAAIVGGLLSIKTSIDTPNLVVAIAYSLMCLGASIIAFAIFLVITGLIKERFPFNPLIRSASIMALWLFLIAAFLVASLYYYEIVSSFRVFKNNG